MKKKILITILLSILFVTGCWAKKSKVNEYLLDDNASATELLNQYMQGVLESNSEKLVAVLPDFMQDDFENIYTKEYLNEYVEYLESKYGNDIKGSVVVEEEVEVLEEDMDGINGYLLEYSNYIKQSKCYMITGAFHLEGNESSEDLEFGDSVARCLFNGKWRIIIA